MEQMKLPFIETNYISAKAPFVKSNGVILGCPYDGSASFRPGARFGPSAIRRASWGIETFSPYFQRDLTHYLIHDMRDLELPFGEKKISLGLIRKALGQILSKKKFPILLGGDHLITLPIIEEILPIYPRLHLLQIDAHTDLREDYLGESLSHSTVMRKVTKHLGEGRLFQIGVRSGTEDEIKLARKWKSIVSFDPVSLSSMIKHLRKQPVYITLDLAI